jgi:hypothetical protein
MHEKSKTEQNVPELAAYVIDINLRPALYIEQFSEMLDFTSGIQKGTR